ncbi:MAG: NAD-dependent epimerase/dehydratase family protein [Candidatus Thermoplasmatota archaeon]|nr:NAD-dependent epimerase/dehydratase family protein [Candidatus Thermoplasmatota archaeon]MCL5665883.1 NAD-dependent epimerase/dehydratase family protein [Candidatus Thermoplasmatota archaeon]
MDGYIGWPLALRLLARGHQVTGVDSFITRRRVREVHSDSLIPIDSMAERIRKASRTFGEPGFVRFDVTDPRRLYSILEKEKPDAIVHLAEQRSAPYSMIGLKQATETMMKNIVSTMNLIYATKDIVPESHILKLGTMGEYGTPNIDIPEGFFEVNYHGRSDTLPFPKFAGSWYHWTKVHDSNNLMFANRLWGTAITDVMQGVVYGTRTSEIESSSSHTRFDIDEVWGTALNRFCAQAIAGLPITPYGKGGQTRGFLSLEDSVQCLTIAIENPPKNGEYRVFNQYDEHYSVNELASKVVEVFSSLYPDRKKPGILHTANPRIEKEEHYYNPENVKLRELGYRTARSLETEISIILQDVMKYSGRIRRLKDVIMPRTSWKESSGKSAVAGTEKKK